jgi:S1-C subfamily serine protease
MWKGELPWQSDLIRGPTYLVVHGGFMTEAKVDKSLRTFSEGLAAAVARVSPAIVAVDARPGVATSGVLWRDGVIVSTNHTVRRDEEITITLADGRELAAKIAGRDPSTDLAVLRVESDQALAVDSIATANDDKLKVGNLTIAVGRVHKERGVTASLGIISVLGDKWRTWRGGEIDRLIRPDVSIFIGFSGGALVDVEGKVIGINTTGLARGAGLTIPASTINHVVDTLLEHGRIARPYLGVSMQPAALPDELRSKFNLPHETALLILSVEAEAPAGRAGMTLGDVLLSLDGAPLVDTDDVQAVLIRSQIGQTIGATILRGGELRELTLSLGERLGESSSGEHDSRRGWGRRRWRR